LERNKNRPLYKEPVKVTIEEALVLLERYMPWSEVRGEHWGKSPDPRAYPEVYEAFCLLKELGEKVG
jgi:hypothetical protein